MNRFFESAVWQRFANEGKLPTVEIELQTKALVNLLGGLLLVGLALIVAWNIFKKL